MSFVAHAQLLQSCLTLCDPMDSSLLGSSVLRISQARVLEWVTISSSRGSCQPRDQTCVSRFLSEKHLNTLKKKKFLKLLPSLWPVLLLFWNSLLPWLLKLQDLFLLQPLCQSSSHLLHLLLNILVPLSTTPQDSSHLLMSFVTLTLLTKDISIHF